RTDRAVGGGADQAEHDEDGEPFEVAFHGDRLRGGVCWLYRNRFDVGRARSVAAFARMRANVAPPAFWRMRLRKPAGHACAGLLPINSSRYANTAGVPPVWMNTATSLPPRRRWRTSSIS